MQITPLEVPDVLLIEPTVFSDDRGFFFESFNIDSLQNHISDPLESLLNIIVSPVKDFI